MHPLTSDDIQASVQEVIDVMLDGAVVLADSSERDWKTIESIGVKAGFLCRGHHEEEQDQQQQQQPQQQHQQQLHQQQQQQQQQKQQEPHQEHRRCPQGSQCKCKQSANHWITFHVRLFAQLVISKTSPSDPPILHLWVSQQACKCCQVKYEKPQLSGAELAKKLEFIMSRSESGSGWSTPTPTTPNKHNHFQRLCELCDKHVCRYAESKSSRGNYRRRPTHRQSSQDGANHHGPQQQSCSPLDGNPFQRLEVSE